MLKWKVCRGKLPKKNPNNANDRTDRLKKQDLFNLEKKLRSRENKLHLILSQRQEGQHVY